MNCLKNCFIFFSLFPFVSLYPIDTDVQPLAIVISIIIFFLLMLRGRLSYIPIFGLVYVVMLLFYINPFGQYDVQYSKIFALLSVPLLYTTCIYLDKTGYELKNMLMIAVTLYLFVALCMLVIPNEVYSIQSYIVRNINSTEFGYRGLSPLSTEPGLFSGLLVSILSLVVLIKNKFSLVEYRYLIIAIILMLSLSRSGTAIVMLLIYFGVTYATLKRFLFLLLIMSILVVIININQEYISEFAVTYFGRLGSIFMLIFTTPEVLFNDSSIFYRINGLLVGLLSLVTNPFGVGFGDVQSQSDYIVDSYIFLNEFYQSSIYGFRIVSSFGYYSTALGLLFVCPVVYLFIKSKSPLENKILALLMLFFSYSISMPLIWMLLAFKKENK